MKNKPVTKVDIGLAVRQKLDEQGSKIAWLARKVNCDPGNLHKHLQKEYIYPELLEKISIALNFDFFIYHSNYIRQTIDNKPNNDMM